jgi:hypothetical protein
LRPYLGAEVDNSIPWSNEISYVVNNQDEILDDLSQYIIYNPGYTYTYRTTNHLLNVTGTTRLQIEAERDICGIRVRPWRFTKDKLELYWRPGFNQNLRWIIVSPDFDVASSPITANLPQFNNYFWGLRDKRYTRNAADQLRDIDESKSIGGYYYFSTKGRVPGYNLGPKMAKIPYLDTAEGESKNIPHNDTDCPPSMLYNGDSSTSWKVRIERDTARTPYEDFTDVLRIDYYEGLTPLETSQHFRESYYYARGIGLVMILKKNFNNFAGSGAADCIDDNDCLGDTITSPDIEVVLEEFFGNPTLSVTLSADGVDFSESVVTTPGSGYYVQVTPPYTGYLETVEQSTEIPAKGIWVEKGFGKVDTSALPSGDYTLNFRVWAPNESFAGETNIQDPGIPWSNQVLVRLEAEQNETRPSGLAAGGEFAV